MSDKKTQHDHGIAIEEKVATKKPSLYKVILLNDDFTPMDFVIHVLIVFFQKSEVAAHEVMLHVHNKGKGIAGIYPFDIAESKMVQVSSFAKKNQYPLKVVIEKD